MSRRHFDPERVLYAEGDLLRADGLNAASASADELRWWHNRACHRPFGIALGLDVSPSIADGGALVATVEPGLAYDAYGRELLLGSKVELPLPPDLTEGEIVELVLSASGRAGSGLCQADRSSWPCENPSEETTELRWQRRRHARLIDPVLARFVRRDGKLERVEDVRPIRTRAFRRPRLARGETSRLNTSWERWTVPTLSSAGETQEIVAGVQTKIDTRAAGFAEDPDGAVRPIYLATALWGENAEHNPSTFFGHVADASASGFTYRLLLRGIGRRDVTNATAFARVQTIGEDRLDLEVGMATPFLAGVDQVARLLPVSSGTVRITDVAKRRLTLAAPIDGMTERTDLGAFRLLRIATAKSEGAERVRLDLSSASGLTAGAALVRIGDAPEGAQILRLSAAAAGSVTLATPPKGWKRGDSLAEARPAARVKSVEGRNLALDAPVTAAAGDVVYLLPTGGAGAAARLSGVGPDGLTVSLDEEGPAVAPGSSLCIAQGRFKVRRIHAATVTVEVEDASPFRAGDLVGELGSAGSSWAAIEAIQENSLTLSGPLDGLAEGDRLARLAVTGRTSVLGLGSDGLTVRIGADVGFQAGQPLARWRSASAPELLGTIRKVEPGRLTLDGPVKLEAGDVVVTLRIPAVCRVRTISPDGRSLALDGPALPAPTGLVGRQDGDTLQLATIRAVDGDTIELDGPITALSTGDTLVELETVGTIRAEPGNPDTELKIESAGDLRPGDLLGFVERWVSRAEAVLLRTATDNLVHIDKPLDGLVAGDMLGLADVVGESTSLRLKDVGGLAAGDRLLLSGADARTGQNYLTSAFIARVRPEQQSITLRMGSLPPDARLRPESMTLGFVYNAGFADTFPAQARRDGLFVAWLGVMEEHGLDERGLTLPLPDEPGGIRHDEET